MALAQRQMEGLARLIGQVPSKPDVDLEQKMGDPFSGVPQSEVSQMIMGARLIRRDLPAEQDGETRVVLDNRVELVTGESKNPGNRKTTCGMIHRGVLCRLKPEYGAGEREIEDLARTIVEQHGKSDPAAQNDKIRGANVTLPIEIGPGRDDPSAGLQIGDGVEFFSNRHSLVSRASLVNLYVEREFHVQRARCAVAPPQAGRRSRHHVRRRPAS